MRVAGVDGCKKGWLAVVLEGKAVVEVKAFEDFDAVIGGLSGVDFIGIDIPIGLAENGEREADLAARALLGKRAGTVFKVPPRRVLEAPDYETAKSLAGPGKQPSIQLWGISQKILQVNNHPLLDRRFFEVHPEVSFFKMAGEPVPSKKSWDGLWKRIDVLATAGISLPRSLGGNAGATGPDDVLDAAAAAWTALRKAEGRAIPLGDTAASIWY